MSKLVPLREAAQALGLSSSTLKAQAQAGRLKAQKVGTLWVVTPREIERYRQTSLNRPGRRSRGQR